MLVFERLFANLPISSVTTIRVKELASIVTIYLHIASSLLSANVVSKRNGVAIILIGTKKITNTIIGCSNSEKCLIRNLIPRERFLEEESVILVIKSHASDT